MMKLMVAAVLAMRAGDTLTGDGGCARSLGVRRGEEREKRREKRRENKRRGEVHRNLVFNMCNKTLYSPAHSLSSLMLPPSHFTLPLFPDLSL